MNYAIEATDGSGFARNGLLVFPSRNGARAYGYKLYHRWFGCQAWRVVEVDDAVTYTERVSEAETIARKEEQLPPDKRVFEFSGLLDGEVEP